MKLVSFVVVLCLLCSLFGSHCSVFAIEFDNSEIVKKSDSSFNYNFNAENIANYHIEEDNIVIYGNYTEFDSSLLYSLTHNKNKICIFYDIDLTDNVSSSHEVMCNNATIYYYKDDVPHIHSYISNSTEIQELIQDINSYVNEILSEINNESERTDISSAFSQYSMYTTGNESFEEIHSGSFRKEEKPYGYIDCNYSVKKYRANDVSSLYIVESHFYFTPGKMAMNLGDNSFDNWLNSSGYAKIKTSIASNEVGYNQVRYGGTPVFKDAYPVNNPGVITIGSSYSQGNTLGYSYTNGFSLDNASFESGSSTSQNTTYGYNKAYQYPEPALSAQKDPMDVEKFTWLYTYVTPRNETNHLLVGYMYEMNNNGHDLLEGDVAITFEYEMTVYNDNWWAFFNKNHTFSGSTFRNHY